MKIHAAEAIAKTLVKKATVDYIIPDSLDRDVTLKIADEIGKCVKKWTQSILYSALLILKYFFKQYPFNSTDKSEMISWNFTQKVSDHLSFFR